MTDEIAALQVITQSLGSKNIPLLCGLTPGIIQRRLGSCRAQYLASPIEVGGCGRPLHTLFGVPCPWFPLQVVLLLLLHFPDEIPQEIQKDEVMFPRSHRLGSEFSSVQFSLVL